MTTPTDFRALCAELTDDLEEWVKGYLISDHPNECTAESPERIARARAALAEPEPPDAGEVAELVNHLLKVAAEDESDGCTYDSAFTRRAAELLERLAPQPEPEVPTNQEIEEWAAASSVPGEFLDPDSGRWERCFTSVKFCATIRSALEEWGTPNLAQTRSSLGDGPAVPEGREPASVSEEPTDEDIMALMPQQMHEDLAAGGSHD